MIARMLDLRWTIAIGIAVGALASPLAGSVVALVYASYDAKHPVVTMQGELLTRGDEEVVIGIGGTKNRACKYVGITASMRTADGTLQDAAAKRLDTPEDNSTKHPGRWHIGLWRVWPTRPSSVAAEVYVAHDCDGRRLVTRIADVCLYGKADGGAACNPPTASTEQGKKP